MDFLRIALKLATTQKRPVPFTLLKVVKASHQRRLDRGHAATNFVAGMITANFDITNRMQGSISSDGGAIEIVLRTIF